MECSVRLKNNIKFKLNIENRLRTKILTTATCIRYFSLMMSIALTVCTLLMLLYIWNASHARCSRTGLFLNLFLAKERRKKFVMKMKKRQNKINKKFTLIYFVFDDGDDDDEDCVGSKKIFAPFFAHCGVALSRSLRM